MKERSYEKMNTLLSAMLKLFEIIQLQFALKNWKSNYFLISIRRATFPNLKYVELPRRPYS